MGAARDIALIGFGAIGQALAADLGRDPAYRLSVLTHDGTKVSSPICALSDVEALIAARPALVVEAAGQGAVAQYGPQLLSAGISLVIASTGALADDALLQRLVGAAQASGARLIVPAGAIGGLDYLTAVAGVKGTTVRYISRKPPAAWSTELAALGHAPERLASAVVLFEGTAGEAARRYPRNLNAGLAVALAAGPARVSVQVIADPAVSANTHEIEVKSPAGSATLSFSNRPSPDNPKTSAVTALSLAQAVRRHFASLVI
ncbi:aspartate dehydrogenase [Angulomicrobium tetraedrale]|uniref:L-aspartate dehydrogenase n=1 Tax=Ancylobacter tetraedralis TaxID=217068 RepID=A0A839Z3F0_9HYPH|nr:aspartate dehydrogenase [Ancylobacter tetraedralis]MBB3770149.1 aspartate dehydrogenase [Ancylobacter tetraedralis]